MCKLVLCGLDDFSSGSLVCEHTVTIALTQRKRSTTGRNLRDGHASTCLISGVASCTSSMMSQAGTGKGRITF